MLKFCINTINLDFSLNFFDIFFSDFWREVEFALQLVDFFPVDWTWLTVWIFCFAVSVENIRSKKMCWVLIERRCEQLIKIFTSTLSISIKIKEIHHQFAGSWLAHLGKDSQWKLNSEIAEEKNLTQNYRSPYRPIDSEVQGWVHTNIMQDCRKRQESQTDSGSSSRNSPMHELPTANICSAFLQKIQHDISKLCNYDTHKIKWVNEKPNKERKAYNPTEVRQFSAKISDYITVEWCGNFSLTIFLVFFSISCEKA